MKLDLLLIITSLYYSPLLDSEEWFVMVWSNSDIRVVDDIYIPENACVVCTTNATPVNSLETFKEKLTSAIKKSKKLTVYLRKREINKDFKND